jgi:hypothetical protein
MSKKVSPFLNILRRTQQAISDAKAKRLTAACKASQENFIREKEARLREIDEKLETMLDMDVSTQNPLIVDATEMRPDEFIRELNNLHMRRMVLLNEIQFSKDNVSVLFEETEDAA